MSEVFSKLYEQTVIEEPQCWQTCGGGFCCSNNHKDFDFNFITQKGTEIIYLPREYAWAEDQLKTFNNTVKRAPKVFRLDLNDISIGLVYTRCELLGICDGIVDKPLLCQLYPFLPLYSFDGKLEGITSGSVFDVTFDALNQISPCTVKTKSEYHVFFGQQDVADRFDTYTRFYLRCAFHLARLMQEGIRSNSTLKDLKGKEFWSRWEMLHLGGRLFDKDQLRKAAEQEYADARAFDPGFNLESESRIIDEINAL